MSRSWAGILSGFFSFFVPACNRCRLCRSHDFPSSSSSPLPHSFNVHEASSQTTSDRSANWVSDLAYDNRTSYDPSTGSGSLGVEFAGTAVSSPSSFGYNSTLNGPYPAEYYIATANKLVGNATANTELQWTEGATRGHFELHLARDKASAVYYGVKDVRTRNSDEVVLATFEVVDKANKLTRPVAGGDVKGGVLRTAFP